MKYNCLLHLYNDGVFTSNWLLYIENILNSCGLRYIWLLQGDGFPLHWLKVVVKNVLEVQFISEWHSQMEKSSKCYHYRNYKLNFECEKYIDIAPCSIRKAIMKFRTCNHKLPIETGRYTNTERHLRVCRHCNLNSIGDEYHYLFVCSHPDIVHARALFLPHFYARNMCLDTF